MVLAEEVPDVFSRRRVCANSLHHRFRQVSVARVRGPFGEWGEQRTHRSGCPAYCDCKGDRNLTNARIKKQHPAGSRRRRPADQRLGPLPKSVAFQKAHHRKHHHDRQRHVPVREKQPAKLLHDGVKRHPGNQARDDPGYKDHQQGVEPRSEEHTSELHPTLFRSVMYRFVRNSRPTSSMMALNDIPETKPVTIPDTRTTSRVLSRDRKSTRLNSTRRSSDLSCTGS